MYFHYNIPKIIINETRIVQENKTKTEIKNCNGEKLTANITSISNEGLVRVTYSEFLYNAFLDVKRKNDSLAKLPRWLQANNSNTSDLQENSSYASVLQANSSNASVSQTNSSNGSASTNSS